MRKKAASKTPKQRMQYAELRSAWPCSDHHRVVTNVTTPNASNNNGARYLMVSP